MKNSKGKKKTKTTTYHAFIARNSPFKKAPIKKDSAKSSKCCPNAKTLYPSLLQQAYNLPLFILAQNEHIDDGFLYSAHKNI